jgi:hypothetical protein
MNIVTPTPNGITVESLRKWLESLPPEFQKAPIVALSFHTIKRIVACTEKDGGGHAVIVNPMGTHLPFDDSLVWHYSING